MINEFMIETEDGGYNQDRHEKATHDSIVQPKALATSNHNNLYIKTLNAKTPSESNSTSMYEEIQNGELSTRKTMFIQVI